MDRFVETSHQGYLSRLTGSCGGVVVGLLLTVGGPGLLFWNEGRSVKRARDLAQGRELVVEGRAEALDRGLEGKLVHVSGRASTEETLRDPEFGVSLTAIHLERRVEMYQWDEDKRTRSKKNLGGSETRETTYEYERKWSRSLIDSGGFKHREGHENPGRWQVPPLTLTASRVTLGAYRLASDQLSQLDPDEQVAASELPSPSGGRQAIPGGYYLGANPSAPVVGDERVSFHVARPCDVSVIAQQTGDSFSPLRMDSGNTLTLVSRGIVPAAVMFETAEQENAALTWILRLVGFVLMGIGLSLVFRPLSVAADVVPFVGNLVGMGTGCAAFGLAAVGSLITIGLGWLAYRPLIAIPLLVLGGGGFLALVVMAAKAGQARRAAGSPG